MNIFNSFKGVVEAQIQSMATAGQLPEGLDTSRVTVEPPRDPSHGDMATNAAMVLAKAAGVKPRDLAEKIAEGLRANDNVEDIDIAGPGFINFRLKTNAWQSCLKEILIHGRAYGDCDLGRGKPVNVEYVSANPTGPLTAGHARGAVFGDALANLLEKAGYDVTREYYVNDAGAQVETLARSTFLRYKEALGHGEPEIPAGFYPGDYLKDVGKALADRDGDKWVDTPEEEHLDVMREFAVEFLMKEIREDLAMLGIDQDVFSSEAKIVAEGAVDEAFKTLEDKGLIYTGVLEPPKGKTPDDWEPRPQTLFKATDFGDDVDRPMKKSDGSWTYFSNDIAYHWNKYRRGYTKMIDVFGADHGGYVKRMKAAIKALTDGEGELEIKLCQLVHMFDNGEPVRMSKRAGTFVTLNDVIKSVGRDVVRFIMLTRRNDQSLDFDYAKVTEQSKDNPVFYVQYCHARCSSVLRHAANDYPQFDLTGEALAKAPMEKLDDPDELQLIRMMAAWPRMVEAAAEAEEPHRVAFYLYDLAALFHQHWNRGREDATLRFMIEDDEDVTHARLAMVQAVRTVIASGLDVMGVEPLEEMHSS